MTRGSELKVSIITDLAKFVTDRAVDGLEDLADAADDSAKALDKIDARDASRTLDRLGDDAKTTARQVDSAFDAMGDSSKSAARKMDDASDKARKSLGDMRDEAAQTAREMGASFSSSGDIGDAFQELAANVPGVLGPLGAAVGAAAGMGVGMILAESERLKETVNEMVDDMIDAGGKLSKEFVNASVRDMSKDGTLTRLKELTSEIYVQGVGWADLAHAKAGDEEAMRRVTAALDAHWAANQRMVDEAGNVDAAAGRQRENNRLLRAEILETKEAMDLAREATSLYGSVAVEKTSLAGGAWDDLSSRMREPIVGRVSVQPPDPAAIARIRQDMTAALGTIVVPVEPGTSATRNTADNSRYRW